MDGIVPPEAIGSAKAVIESHEGLSEDGEMGMRSDSNCEDGLVEKNTTPDLAASMSESGCENGLVGNDTTNLAASIDKPQKDSESGTHEAEPSTDPTPNDLEGCPHEPGREVAQDKEWVTIMASNLKQRGKGEVWVELADTWVLLQRMWDRVEVCSFSIDPIPYLMSSLWGAGPLQR